MSRTAHTLRIAVSLGTALVVAAINTLDLARVGVGERRPENPSVLDVAAKTLERPTITPDATPAQTLRLAQAIERFENAGLQVPPVEIAFAESPDDCDGHQGLFSPQHARVTYCDTPSDWVYEHELAHAWVEFNVSEHTRQTFMTWRRLETWNDLNGAWGQQGAEQATFAIQQGVTGPAENPTTEHQLRLCGFQILTGTTPPKLDPTACRE